MRTGCTHDEAIARAELVAVESYQVQLDITATDAARSRTEIRFSCVSPGSSTFADLAAGTLKSAVLNGRQLDADASAPDDRLLLSGLEEVNVLIVEAVTPYSPDNRGVSRFSDPSDGAEYVLVYCYPTSAPRVFCSFDQPDLGADLTLSILAPQGWECVANGPALSRPADGATGPWEFAPVKAMKPYELTVCAGPYITACKDEFEGLAAGVPLTVRCRTSLASSADLSRAADVVKRALAYYEELLGVPCPTDKVDVVFAPELAPMAAQVAGLMLVNEMLLHRIADRSDDFVTMVLGHEVSHLWFGCLVEGRWWDDLWLAEALATYLSFDAGEQALGMDSPWAEFALRDQQAAYTADRLPSTQPVSSPVASAADALSRPTGITYSKGASIIRQLAALIGDEPLRAGLRKYLTVYAGRTATTDDLVECWSEAGGRDLKSWAEQWFKKPGTNTLRPEVKVSPDGSIESFAVLQEAPSPASVGEPEDADPQLRIHHIRIGLYDSHAGRLSRRAIHHVEIAGGRTEVPGLVGEKSPAVAMLNADDLTFARVRFDPRSWQALFGAAMEVGEPVTESACWNAAWDMTTSAELDAAGFVDLVARRVSSGTALPGITDLLGQAVMAADHYSPPGQRSDLRRQLAEAALAGAESATAGSRLQQGLTLGFATSAQSESQLKLLAEWLRADSLPPGVVTDIDLRGRILLTLAAAGLACEPDLDELVAADPVSGRAKAATCRALRPDLASKEAAWTAALAADQTPRMALAHAQGMWAPGQEELLMPWRERYFSEALVAAATRDSRTQQRLGRFLYPSILAEPATVGLTDGALARGDLTDTLRQVLVSQKTILQEVMAARASSRNGGPSASE